MKLGDKIRELRIKKGVSQEEMAQAIGKSAKAISAWENNNKLPRMGTVEKIAQYFNVPKTYLVDDELSPSDLPSILAASGKGFLVGGPVGAAIAGILSAAGTLSDAVSEQEDASIGFMVVQDTMERRIIEAYRVLTEDEQRAVRTMLNSLTADRYNKRLI